MRISTSIITCGSSAREKLSTRTRGMFMNPPARNHGACFTVSARWLGRWALSLVSTLLMVSPTFSVPRQALVIRTAHESEAERATKAQLEAMMKQYNLEPWTFTREILVDEQAIPHSHPVLTLHTRHLKQDDLLLSTYLHEQLHWFLSRHEGETKNAEDALVMLYPKVPVGFPEGGEDRESTYLHLLVCWLEQQADEALVGQQRTERVMQFWSRDHYRWVYETVLKDGAKVGSVVRAHHLDHPEGRQKEPISGRFADNPSRFVGSCLVSAARRAYPEYSSSGFRAFARNSCFPK